MHAAASKSLASFLFHPHVVQTNRPLNGVPTLFRWKQNPSFNSDAKEVRPKHPDGLIPKGMYWDGIHRRAPVWLKQTCYHTEAT